MNKKHCQYPKLITLSGLDGSGKSTQIELLKDYLKSKDKTFFYFHGPSSSVSALYNFLPIFSWKKYKKRKKDDSVSRANWIEIQLRKIALGIDICRFKRLLKKTKVDYIISDRYFYDSIINIQYLSSCHSRESGNPENKECLKTTGSRIKCGMTNWISEYIPKPDYAFYIDVNPEIIMQRERKPDQGLEYLIAKNKLFEKKVKDWDMIVLDGEKNKEEIFEEIKSNIHV